MAVTSGIRAGICAAEYAREQPVLAEPDGRLVQDKVAEMLAPLGRKGGIGWREFEEVLQRVITEGLGPRRTGPGLQQALAKLERLTAYAEDLAAQNYHDLCRVLEVKNMVTVGKAMATAALFRTESRFGISHHREDYPATDDAHWLGQVVLQDIEGSIVPRFAPLRY
ncbi:MAG: hypothetical protein H5U01_15190 [Clostridia bacterium]|nr:hypothetical protein [Clostridia bacterium]